MVILSVAVLSFLSQQAFLFQGGMRRREELQGGKTFKADALSQDFLLSFPFAHVQKLLYFSVC